MSGPKFDPHDPRLTAYVLGELDEDARAEVEALLDASPEARAVVNDLGDIASWLEEDLDHEPVTALSEDARARIRSAVAAPACEFALDPVGSRSVARDGRGSGSGGPVVLSALVAVVALCVLTFVLPSGGERRPSPGEPTPLARHDTDSGDRPVVGHEFAAISNTIADRMREDDFERPVLFDNGVTGTRSENPRDFDGDGRRVTGFAGRGIAGTTFEVEPPGSSTPLSGVMRWGAWQDEGRLYYVPSRRSSNEMNGSSRWFDSSWTGRTVDSTVGEFTAPEQEFGSVNAPETTTSPTEPRGGYDVAVTKARRGREVERLARANLALADVANRRQEVVLQLRSEQKDLAARFDDGTKATERIEELEERVRFEQQELVNVERTMKQLQLAQLNVNEAEAVVNYVPLERGFVNPVDAPVSNPKVDVQTDSYHWTRLNVENGTVPPPDTVRVEDFVNSFTYTIPEPEHEPVAVVLERGPCPWNADHRLVRVALKGREADPAMRPPSNYTFLVDLADSEKNQLGLVQHGLRSLNDGLAAKDRLAIVANGPTSEVQLDANGDERDQILGAIDNLKTVTSQNGVRGIRAAYTNGNSGFVDAGVNSVVICTDRNGLLAGDDIAEVDEFVREQANNGLSLNVVQFGRHVPPDGRLVELARAGNGRFAQVGGTEEVREVFGEELRVRPVVAEDVDLQVEFNPARVTSYRLVGFDDPPVTSAGSPVATDNRKQTLSAGQRFTALYEIEPRPVPARTDQLKLGQLRYQQLAPQEAAPVDNELLALTLKYRRTDTAEPVEYEEALVDDGSSQAPSPELAWATAVAAYGLVMRDSAFKGTADLDLVERLAVEARGPDAEGQQREFVELVRRTRLARARVAGDAGSTPVELADEDAREKASVGGKYRGLLRKIESPEDVHLYADFDDFGWWEAESYRSHNELPKAHWVYVYPHWYLWQERTVVGEALSNTAPRAASQPAAETTPDE